MRNLKPIQPEGLYPLKEKLQNILLLKFLQKYKYQTGAPPLGFKGSLNGASFVSDPVYLCVCAQNPEQCTPQSRYSVTAE